MTGSRRQSGVDEVLQCEHVFSPGADAVELKLRAAEFESSGLFWREEKLDETLEGEDNGG